MCKTKFIHELSRIAKRDIAANAGNLIVAPDQTLLEEIAPVVRHLFGSETVLLVKNDKETQFHKHRSRVDSGLTSILVLLKEEADKLDQLDLPGDYCKTVLVAHPDSFPETVSGQA